MVALHPGEIVGATEVELGSESGISNLFMNGQILMIDNQDQIQNGNIEIPKNGASYILSGSSLPDACVKIQNPDASIGIMGAATADASGKWQIKFPINAGQNSLKVFVLGWENSATNISIPAFIISMQWPFNQDINTTINAWLGYTDYHYNELGEFHDGIDIGAPTGTEIRAVADGNVIYIQNDPSASGGNMVFIDHGGWFSGYLHLSSINIKGLSLPLKNIVPVKAGDVIGIIGNTGCGSCGVHLHFSAYKWTKEDWEKSTGSKFIYPVRNYGILININPPAGIILANNQNSSDLLK